MSARAPKQLFRGTLAGTCAGSEVYFIALRGYLM